MPWPRRFPRPAFCRVATVPSRSSSPAPSTTSPISAFWRSTRRWRASPIRRRDRDRADLSVAVGALRSRADRFRDAGRKAGSRLAQRPLPPAGKARRWRVPVAYGGENGIDLEDVAKKPEHHARRSRGAACRRRLPRRHDRLHAGLVLSVRARQIAAHAATAQSAGVHAGGNDLDRRRAGRHPVPGRTERLASAWGARRSGPFNCIAIPCS